MKFRTTVELGGKTATGIEVPEEVVTSFGKGKRVPVQATINGYTYRSTVVSYQGRFMLPLSAENRTGANIAAGDEIEVQLVLDDAPREVSLPADFSAALAADADAKRFFEGLSYSNKRRFVLSIEDAKTPETRQRRIEKSVASLREGKI
jgi:hypothetical protein